MTTHIRNPIKRHGDYPSAQFVIIPNELARDRTLSNHAYRVAIEIRTHAENFEVSMASIAERHGWSRTTVRQAFDELIMTRWLAVRRYVNSAGHRIFDEYHLHVSRAFTEDESSDLNASVTLRANGGPAEVTSLSSEKTGGCAIRDHPPALWGDTKEDQQEHQKEDQSKNQSSDWWDSDEGSGYGLIGPGGVCCSREATRTRTTENEQEASEVTCFGCKTLGRDGCAIHTTSAVGSRTFSEAPR